jgi:peptidoglycan/xylan/chitin deacetylase (PgdA/CDA1 family)
MSLDYSHPWKVREACDMGRAGGYALILAAVLALTQALDACQGSPRQPRLAVRGPSLGATLVPGDRRGRQGFTLGAVALPVRASTTSDVVPPGRPALNVPILMYHYIRVNPVPWDGLGVRLSVTPADFEAQIGWLVANGYHAVDLQDLERYLAGARSLPSRPVVLTFDDGYEDFYAAAYPILKAHRYTAVSYVVTGFLGGPRYMTAAQVVELDASGIEIGAHTVTHPDLTRLGAAGLQHEIFDSKATLEALLRHPVLDFCYPSGKLDGAVVQQVQAAGFQSATTTVPGTLHGLGDRFTWTRVRVQGGESLAAFASSLGPPEPTVPLEVPAPGSALSPAQEQPPAAAGPDLAGTP